MIDFALRHGRHRDEFLDGHRPAILGINPAILVYFPVILEPSGA
jgi:hypothetical protein